MKALSKKHSVFLALFLCLGMAGCVSDSDLIYLNDKVSKVEQRMAALEQNLSRSTHSEIDSIRKAQAKNTHELENIKKDLETIKYSLEEIKTRRLAKIESGQQILGFRVSNLESDMGNVKSHLKLDTSISYQPTQPITSEPGQKEAMPVLPQEKKLGPKEQEVVPPKTQPRPPEQAPKPGTSVASLPSPTAPSERVEKPLDQLSQGIDLYNKGNIKEAMAIFDGIIKSKATDEKKSEAYYWMAECYMKQKEYEKAILAYQDLVKLYPQSPKVPSALYRQALAFIEIKDNMSALIILKQLVKKYRTSPEAKLAENKIKELESKKR